MKGVKMKRKDPETRYTELLRKQKKELAEYAAKEIGFAGDLLDWYRLKKREIPGDEYRGAAFFLNREYARKPGSLTLLYLIYVRMIQELPEPEPKIAFDYLAYRFRVYAIALRQGGFD
jgi:hypothetical protein